MDYKQYKFEVIFSDREPMNVECTRDYLFQTPFCRTAIWLADEDMAMDNDGAKRDICVYPDSTSKRAANFLADGIKARCDICEYNKKNRSR